MGKKLCTKCKGEGKISEVKEVYRSNGLHDEFGRETGDRIPETDMVTCDHCYGTGVEPSQRKLKLLKKIEGSNDENLIARLLNMTE